MKPRLVLASTLIGLIALAAGCAGRAKTAPSTRPAAARAMATDIAPETATAAYWLEQDAVAWVGPAGFDALLREADHVLRQRRFEIDRLDYRGGRLVSKPLVSKQFWEVWRNDVVTSQQVLASSVGTYRRTVHWEILPSDGGKFAAAPRVVVERISGTPRRVTMVTNTRYSINTAEATTGLPTSRLEDVPADQWYAIGRDNALEAALAKDLFERLRSDKNVAILQRTDSAGGK